MTPEEAQKLCRRMADRCSDPKSPLGHPDQAALMELERFIRVRSWRCFFCDEVFTDATAAREHFGARMDQRPGCVEKVNPGGERGLLQSLRRTEDELARAIESVQHETLDALQSMRAMQGRHAEALRRSEEAGYQRGIEDMQRQAVAS